MIKKTIVFILPNLDSGGVEIVTLNYLKQLNNDKYNIILIVFDKTNDLLKLVPEDIKLIDLETKSTKKSLFKLINVFKNINPDIVYTGHSRVTVLVQIVKLFTRKFKHLARMQSMPSLEKKYGTYGTVHRILYSMAFKNADIVLAETKDMKDDAIKTFSLQENKVKVMHNPLDKKAINKAISNNESVPFSSKDIIAIASGRLCKDKGYDILIKAISLIIDKYPNFKLYILGRDDGEGSNLKKIISNYNLENNIILEGFQSNPYAYYAASNMFILSSRREGFPNVLIENYYLDIPIVTTKCVPIVSELVKDKINGYTCDVENTTSLSDAITKCIKNIKKVNINNPEYIGSRLEELF